MFDSNKVLESKTSTLFSLFFSSNSILYLFFFIFLILDWYFLITAVIAQIFVPIAELAIPTEILTKEAKAEMKKHPVTIQAKISKWSV